MSYLNSISAALGAYVAAETAAQHLGLAFSQHRAEFEAQGWTAQFVLLDDLAFDAAEHASQAWERYASMARVNRAQQAEMAYIRSFRAHGCWGDCPTCKVLEQEAKVLAGEVPA
jgi:hypothetical protein